MTSLAEAPLVAKQRGDGGEFMLIADWRFRVPDMEDLRVQDLQTATAGSKTLKTILTGEPSRVPGVTLETL